LAYSHVGGGCQKRKSRIGAISAAKSKKAMSQSGNYQDSVTTLLGHTFDDNAVRRDDEDEQDEVSLKLNRSRTILSAIEKACDIMFKSDKLLTSSHSFERLSMPFDQAPSANRVGLIK